MGHHRNVLPAVAINNYVIKGSEKKNTQYKPVISQALVDIIVITLDLKLRPRSRVITNNDIKLMLVI